MAKRNLSKRNLIFALAAVAAFTTNCVPVVQGRMEDELPQCLKQADECGANLTWGWMYNEPARLIRSYTKDQKKLNKSLREETLITLLKHAGANAHKISHGEDWYDVYNPYDRSKRLTAIANAFLLATNFSGTDELVTSDAVLDRAIKTSIVLQLNCNYDSIPNFPGRKLALVTAQYLKQHRQHLMSLKNKFKRPNIKAKDYSENPIPATDEQTWKNIE